LNKNNEERLLISAVVEGQAIHWWGDNCGSFLEKLYIEILY
jgi:hypothetical protein